jgi:EAL domain-containing protein (putative c-di-GMP-specific phosphodiesterase class I)
MTDNPLVAFLAAEATGSDGGSGRSQIDNILDAVRRHLGMEIAFTSRFVGDRREFTHISTAIPVPSAPGDSEPLDQSYCWHVLNGRLPELIREAAGIPFAHTLPITFALPVGCHISVPLRLKDGSVYGSLCCLSRSPDHSLTERDLATVKAFADLAIDQIELQRDCEASRRASIARIEDSLAAGQPAIFLQPIHRLEDAVPVGAEALARFPDFEVRPPNAWFDEAFEVELGVELELAAVEQALGAFAYLAPGQYLSVNVSPATILSERLEPLIASAGRRDLVLEVTEHRRVDDYRSLARALDRLRPHARIAIDDVGAGYAGLRHIVALAPDLLKLDISLTRDVDRDPAKRALAVALASFASHIGSVIVAEGIERPEERRTLCELGIAYGQGWLFSRAMPLVAAQQCLFGAATCDDRTDTSAATVRRPALAARSRGLAA